MTSWETEADRLAARSISGGDPTGWFDRLYAAGAAGEVPMPWDRDAPHPLLVRWAEAAQVHGGRAAVVGCGLGADAEYVAGLGYDTVAFDVSDTAIDLARQRHPGSAVHYTVADLLDLPAAWMGAFDLVVEVHTAQALPDPPRRAAIANIARLVAPGGSLVVVAFRGEGGDVAGPPWPLTRADIDAFAAGDLVPARVDETTDPRSPDSLRWLATFHRP